jgi:hypothetical protein
LIANAIDWLRDKTESGICQILSRLDITYKRARSYIRSPDKFYQPKLDRIQLAELRAWYAPDEYVLVYQDEFSYYRQPTLERDFEQVGRYQPLAHRSYRSNTCFRGIGALNPVTGAVTYTQASKASIKQLYRFYDALVDHYPTVKQIYVVQDNWPVHFHPDLLAYLQPQTFPFPVRTPPNWPSQPTPKAEFANLPIHILPLPTYASWCNPIEKLWRWVRQEVIHLHRKSDQWQVLKQQVIDFINQFANGSQKLLRYVGLLPD